MSGCQLTNFFLYLFWLPSIFTSCFCDHFQFSQDVFVMIIIHTLSFWHFSDWKESFVNAFAGDYRLCILFDSIYQFSPQKCQISWINDNNSHLSISFTDWKESFINAFAFTGCASCKWCWFSFLTQFGDAQKQAGQCSGMQDRIKAQATPLLWWRTTPLKVAPPPYNYNQLHNVSYLTFFRPMNLEFTEG